MGIFLSISILIFLLMILTKPDKSDFNFLAYIRNLYITYALYYTFIQGPYFWLFWVLAIPFELLLQLINLSIIPFHSCRKRTKDAYRMFSKLGRIDPRICEYMTEGFHLEKIKDVEKEQKQKWDWIINKAKITSNSTVLEVGSGHGKMASYIKNKTNCLYVCNTLSVEQHNDLLAKNQKSILGDILQIDLTPYKNYFDVIILNGPIEHIAPNGFLSIIKNSATIYKELFMRLESIVNPNSQSKRIIATCIHLRRPLKGLKEFILFPFGLDVCFGGNYPKGPYGLTRYVTKSTNVEEIVDTTEPMYLYSLWYRTLLNLHSKTILKLFLTDVKEIINNAAWFYWVMSNWAEQFAQSGTNTPPMQNLWIVLECHASNILSTYNHPMPEGMLDRNGDYSGVGNIPPLGQPFPRLDIGINIKKELAEFANSCKFLYQ